MYQPYPSSGQAAGPLRPPAPAPVRAAVKFMYAGAAVSAVPVIVALAFIGGGSGDGLRWNGPRPAAAQISHWRPLIIAVVIVTGLVAPAVWLWMARANGQGRNWARILSTVLFGLATLQLTGLHSLAAVFWAMLTWLTGLAAVWQLWRPVSGAFFRQCRQAALTRRR